MKSRSKPKALLWDNDGILVDTERHYFESSRRALSELGLELGLELFREVFLTSSRGMTHFFGDDLATLSRVRARRDQIYTEILEDLNPILPNVSETLVVLAEQYRMAIVTSCPPEHFRLVHRRTNILHLFEFILTPDLYQHPKPHPEPYLTALEKLGLNAEECLVIEDSERGLRSAYGAGIPCVAIPNELTAAGDFHFAHAVLGNISELLPFLAKWT